MTAPRICNEILPIRPEDAAILRTQPRNLMCALPEGHTGYHLDQDGMPFGPYRHPETTQEATR